MPKIFDFRASHLMAGSRNKTLAVKVPGGAYFVHIIKKMKPTYHFIISLVLCAILYPFYGIYSLLALLGGFLIDIDHYIFYIIKKKDLSIRRMYDYCMNKTYNSIFCIFHNVEFVFVILMLSLIIPKFFIFAVGVVVHLTADFIAIANAGRLRKEIRAFSLIARMI